MPTMPTFPLEAMLAVCTEAELTLVQPAFNGNKLRARKPFPHIDYVSDSLVPYGQACANYVWRMLCLDYADFKPHSLVPMFPDYDILCYFIYSRNHINVASVYAGYIDTDKSVEMLDALIERIKVVASIIPLKEAKMS